MRLIQIAKPTCKVACKADAAHTPVKGGWIAIPYFEVIADNGLIPPRQFEKFVKGVQTKWMELSF